MFPFIAALCAGLFAGAAGYISLVEHWARLQAGPSIALAQFRPGFPRARGIQATLAITGGVSAIVAWLSGGGASWLIVALLLLGVVAFTLRYITPVYTRLLDPELTPESPETPALLAQWGRLHDARSVAGLLAFLIALASW